MPGIFQKSEKKRLLGPKMGFPSKPLPDPQNAIFSKKQKKREKSDLKIFFASDENFSLARSLAHSPARARLRRPREEPPGE